MEEAYRDFQNTLKARMANFVDRYTPQPELPKIEFQTPEPLTKVHSPKLSQLINEELPEIIIDLKKPLPITAENLDSHNNQSFTIDIMLILSIILGIGLVVALAVTIYFAVIVSKPSEENGSSSTYSSSEDES